MISRLGQAAWLVWAAGCVLLIGCMGSKEPPVFKVAGRVVENGQPVPFQGYREGYNCLEVDFYPVDDAGNPKAAPHYQAMVAEDGTFNIGGEKGRGIVAGKYRVAVRHVDRRQQPRPDKSGNIDSWKGRFGEKTSPFLRDVTGSQGDIVIELAEASKAGAAKP